MEQKEKERSLQMDLLASYHDLCDNIKVWEQKFVFKAPFDGKVEYLKFISDNQFVQTGEEIFGIVPKETNIFGQVLLPSVGAGKVKLGSKVTIKLDNYPYVEYGSIEGVVSSISLLSQPQKAVQVPVETYLIVVDLPKGLITNYGEALDFQFEIGGSADIIVKERRLIERLFDNLKYRTQNIDVYRQQQSVSSSGGISISQQIDLTGGTLSLNTGLNYLRNFGESIFTQFSSTPVRLGYSQSLFGVNSYKWSKKIEPLKYDKAQKQFLYSREDIAQTAASHFFDLALAQSEYDMAVENLSSTDSLYIAGKERSRISTISQADLLTLELDLINAENSLENASVYLQRTMNSFITFFGLDKDSKIRLVLPEKPNDIIISAEEALLYMKEFNPDIMSYRQQILESEQALERSQKTGGFDANVSASIGFNQAGRSFTEAYTNPSRQDVINISFSIPIIDWGIRKGQVNMARNNLQATLLSVEQSEQNLELELTATVSEFNRQQNLFKKAEDAMNLAIRSYEINKQRFIVGRVDINTVTLSLNRRREAQRNYLSILSNYWRCYFNIRKLTLFDFDGRESLSFQFEKLLE